MTQTGVLTRAEDFYLNILRTVILGVATLALLVTLGSLAFGVPALTPRGHDPARPPAGLHDATLGDFVAEQNAAGAPVGEAGSDQPSASAAVLTASPELKDAAGKLQRYVSLRMHSETDLGKMIGLLQQTAETIPSDRRPAYEAGLVDLTRQLLISKEAPLSPSNLADVLTWHAAKFKAAAEAEEQSAAAKRAQGLLLMELAGAAFMTFLRFCSCSSSSRSNATCAWSGSSPRFSRERAPLAGPAAHPAAHGLLQAGRRARSRDGGGHHDPRLQARERRDAALPRKQCHGGGSVGRDHHHDHGHHQRP